jgi:PAS domain S-box-containing protein
MCCNHPGASTLSRPGRRRAGPSKEQRLNDEEGEHQVRLRLQTTLARFGELALRSDDLDEILTEACRLAGEALGTDLAKVVELQRDGRTLLVRAGVGWRPGVVGVATITATDDTSEGHALRTGEPMISPDIATEKRFTYPPFLIENGVRAVANVLIIGGQNRPPFGILQVDSRRPRQFTENDTAFLRSYANLLAATVDRVRVIGDMRDGEARLRLALEAGELGSWDLDLISGDAKHTPRYDQIFGYADPPPAWSYDAFLGHVLPEDRAHVASAFEHAVDAGSEWHFQCRIRRADDGAIRWIDGRGTPDAAKGNRPTHLLGIVADITERKHAEETLRRSNDVLETRVAERTRELTAANASLRLEAEERVRVEEALRQSHKMEAVGQLTGGIAHDFNNLLTGISGSLELIRTRAAQGRTAEFGRYIEGAMTSVDRAAALTHRLLAFSRRQTLDPKATDVNRLVGTMEELFRRTVGPNIRVETRLADGLWATLCDPNQLENALLNLVINARDAMAEGGRLLIGTANAVLPDERGDVPPTNAPAGEYTALFVTDTGTGMAPDLISRAFDPFFTTKPIGQGTGLGLSMIYGFVQQSGGHVVLRSAVGQGATVTIYLPRHLGAVGDAAEPPAVVRLPPPADCIGVLVVEDEATVRMVILEVLSDCGYTVLEAEDSRSGLRVAESGVRIDLLVTDIGLPGSMNGRQLAEAARLLRPGLKVLFITGLAEGGAVETVRMEPRTEMMTKPFTVDALAARVLDMTGGPADGVPPAARLDL